MSRDLKKFPGEKLSGALPLGGLPAVVPVRTCIGCRERAPVTELLRVVVSGQQVVPDQERRALGRGASLHPDPVCLALAVRRRAFGRAFRRGDDALDLTPVREFLV